jgi:predicted transcriptional regulator
MATNICIPFFEDGEKVTGQVSGAAVSGKRFLKVVASLLSGPAVSDAVDGGNYQVGQCGLGDDAIAVSEWDAAVGEDVGLHTAPGVIVPVTAGAAIPFGSPVMSDGKAIAHDGNAAHAILGKAMTAASGADVDAQIKLRV